MDARLNITLVSGAIASFNIDSSKFALGGLDFVQDSYVISMKPGIAVQLNENGYVEPAIDSTKKVVGFLVNDVGGYQNQNTNSSVTGQIAVLVGSGNQFITENVVETDITAGSLLYADATSGKLTKTATGDAIAIAITANTASNPAVLVQTL